MHVWFLSMHHNCCYIRWLLTPDTKKELVSMAIFMEEYQVSGPVHIYLNNSENFFFSISSKSAHLHVAYSDCFSLSKWKCKNNGNTIASITEHSTDTTIWSSKWSHHAVIYPDLTQNLSGAVGFLFHHQTAFVLNTGLESNFSMFTAFYSQLGDLATSLSFLFTMLVFCSGGCRPG